MRLDQIYDRLPAFLILLFMPLFLNGQYTGTANLCHERGGLFINEFSNGQGGGDNSEEYIELVVTGDPSQPLAPVDLTGWILDDNNFPGAGEGNAMGHLIFGDCYNAVPPGSILVIYNEGDPNPSLPPDDPRDDDGDGVYIIPHTHPCLDACADRPSTTDSGFCPCESLFDLPDTWHLNLRNAGDVIQVRDVCETPVHALRWNGVTPGGDLSNNPVSLEVSDQGQSARVVIFNNAVNDDWLNTSNYGSLDFSGNESPGVGNNPANTDMIERIRAGISPCNGSIADCRDTDAGDLVLPADAPSALLPLQLCEGEDIGAFSTSYEAPDEFLPDANGFDFGYLYLLTNNDAPEYTVLDVDNNGEFDFSQLPPGSYLVWGLSLVLPGSNIDIVGFTESLATSIQDILEITACGLDFDLDNLNTGNDPVEIIIGTPSTTEFSGPLLGCDNFDGTTSVNLTGFEEEITGGTGLPVNWYTDANASDLITDPANYVTDQSEVFFTLTDGCESGVTSVTISPSPGPQPMINVLADPGCDQSSQGVIELTTNGDLMLREIDWNQDQFDGQQVLIGISSGFYAVTVTDNSGCRDSTSIDLRQSEPLRLVCQSDEPATASGGTGSIALDFSGGTGPFFLSWEGPDPGANIFETNRKFDLDNLPAGFYTFFLQDAEGCIAGCQAEVTTEKPKRVFFPNAFSPDGDGSNDIFNAQNAEQELDLILLLQVYDRWGELIFERQNLLPGDQDTGWDGSFKGQALDPGIYVYYAELSFVNGSTGTVKGDVLLVR